MDNYYIAPLSKGRVLVGFDAVQDGLVDEQAVVPDMETAFGWIRQHQVAIRRLAHS